VKLGLDTNVLVYAHLPGLPEHEAVRSFLLEKLSRPEVVLVLTPAVLHEFVHVVTDGRRFDPPVSMAEALAVARGYLGRTNVECLPLEEAPLLEAFDLLERLRLGRRRVADTLFAATLLHHGVREVITCDPDDFGVFDDVAVVDPRRT